jgi:hypothetical protein
MINPEAPMDDPSDDFPFAQYRKRDHFGNKVLAIILTFIVVMFVIAMVFLAIPAFSHENYPIECCHEQHCHPVPCKEITMRNGNYIWHNMVFVPSTWRTSPDGGCHVCEIADKTPLCIMVGGSV